MSHDEEPGSEKVTASTHAFADIDAQVFPGPGRGATPSEAAASDRWGGPSPATVEAYRRMFDIVARHQRALSERRVGVDGGAVAHGATGDHMPQPGEMVPVGSAAATRVPRRVQPAHHKQNTRTHTLRQEKRHV
jgi:hypothetical protein